MKAPRTADVMGSSLGARRARFWVHPLLILGIGGMARSATNAEATVVNFDNLAAGVQPGTVLADSGVVLSTGVIPDDIQVGDVITFANPVGGFEVIDDPNFAPSPPNYIIPQGGLQQDVLISFTAPVTSVSVVSDHFVPEERDLIRLIVLGATETPNQFTVLRFVEAYDDAVGPPDDTLAVNLDGAPFSYAVFQTTTELEGFDDLTFTPVDNTDNSNNPPPGDNPPADANQPPGNNDSNSPAGTSGTTTGGTTTGGDQGASGGSSGSTPAGTNGQDTAAAVSATPCLCPASTVAMLGFAFFWLLSRPRRGAKCGR
jgi:hypothetical protein